MSDARTKLATAVDRHTETPAYAVRLAADILISGGVSLPVPIHKGYDGPRGEGAA